jgi:hypothetical protein
MLDKEATRHDDLFDSFRLSIQATLAEGYVHSREIGEAESHRLIAEALHDILRTLEVKRREAVEAEIASRITDIRRGEENLGTAFLGSITVILSRKASIITVYPAI